MMDVESHIDWIKTKMATKTSCSIVSNLLEARQPHNIERLHLRQ